MIIIILIDTQINSFPETSSVVSKPLILLNVKVGCIAKAVCYQIYYNPVNYNDPKLILQLKM